jgi:nitrogenase molybdenum-iron protein beta chain
MSAHANGDFLERPRTFCALGGALLAVESLPRVIPVLHASMGCGGSIYWTQHGTTGYFGAGYCGGLAAPSSNVGEREVVFGGSGRLDEQLRNTVDLMDGDLYFVLTGCTTEIIGDDIRPIVEKYRAEGVSIIGAETGGFRGDGYLGYDLVLAALARDFVSKKETKRKKKVNLFGAAPGQDVFWRGNLLKLRGLLEKLGLEVNSFFTERDSLDGVRDAGDAALNVLVSEHYGLGAAETFKSVHGIPYLADPFPIGPTATEAFLRRVARKLRLSRRTVESVIAAESEDWFRYTERIADAFNDLDWQRYAVVIGDANYAPAITSFLADDLGWLPKLMVVTDQVEPGRRRLFEDAARGIGPDGGPRVVFEPDPSEVGRHFWASAPRRSDSPYRDDFFPCFVVGSSFDREFAGDIGADHLSVSYPVVNRVVLNRGYAGYEGSLTLIEDLLSAIAAQR